MKRRNIKVMKSVAERFNAWLKTFRRAIIIYERWVERTTVIFSMTRFLARCLS